MRFLFSSLSLRLWKAPNVLIGSASRLQPTRALATTPPLLKNPMPQRPQPPPEEEIEESYLKGSGPGGQKIVRP